MFPVDTRFDPGFGVRVEEQRPVAPLAKPVEDPQRDGLVLRAVADEYCSHWWTRSPKRLTQGRGGDERKSMIASFHQEGAP